MGAGDDTLNITAGNSTLNFFYGDTVAASPTVTANGGAGPLTVTQIETITAGSASKLVITSLSVSGAASSSATLGPITVQEQDALGNPVPAGAGRRW